jgi:hypothetical protein
MTKYLIAIYFLITFCFTQCKKNPIGKTELEKLPAATEIGANSFGCLINGVAYTPGGGALDQVMIVQYDPAFEGGQFSIKTQRIFNSNNYISLSIHADSINSIGIYPLGLKTKYWVYYDDLKNNNCAFETINQAPTLGTLRITKFDLANRITSGTFSFKVSTVECGTIDVTDGRFDVRY